MYHLLLNYVQSFPQQPLWKCSIFQYPNIEELIQSTNQCQTCQVGSLHNAQYYLVNQIAGVG